MGDVTAAASSESVPVLIGHTRKTEKRVIFCVAGPRSMLKPLVQFVREKCRRDSGESHSRNQLCAGMA